VRIFPLVLGIVLLVACSPTQLPTSTVAVTPLLPTEPPVPTATATSLPPTEAPQSVQGPIFEPAECFSVNLGAGMSGGGYDLACGYLVVPENRSQPEGKKVKLPVMVFHTQSPNPKPDPVIYLAGGGGFNVMPLLPVYMQLFGDAILRNRDFIAYNQRGAPLSEPALPCPGYGNLLYDLARNSDLSKEEIMAQKVAFLCNFHDDLVEQGINLEMYDTTANAADANDLRIALGYEQANY
jgi:pimeloyl-ACP methyl ester carboxylesterase